VQHRRPLWCCRAGWFDHACIPACAPKAQMETQQATQVSWMRASKPPAGTLPSAASVRILAGQNCGIFRLAGSYGVAWERAEAG
jgi:hypothetical protein